MRMCGWQILLCVETRGNSILPFSLYITKTQSQVMELHERTLTAMVSPQNTDIMRAEIHTARVLPTENFVNSSLDNNLLFVCRLNFSVGFGLTLRFNSII